jgi:hypothetical protein
MNRLIQGVAVLLAVVSFPAISAFAADPLAAWNEGSPKQSIIAFVEKVTSEGSPDFVPPAGRIARHGRRSSQGWMTAIAALN